MHRVLLRTRDLAAVAALVSAGCQPVGSGVARVTIPRGANVGDVADSLSAHGLIADRRLFVFYARITGQQRRLHAGTFELPYGASDRELLALLQSGSAVAESRLVIPEGLMLSEVAEQVERQLGIPADSVLEAAADSTLRAELGVTRPALEGYLYPSTYLVPAGATAHAVVRQMVAEFERQWDSAWTARADSLGFTRDQIVTLASIVEGEVRYEADRPFVASVYWNRLRRGMRLQADPTVIYALQRRRRLYEKDYLTRSPYNTYLIDSLPPGPINSPSAASIRATLYPARTDFLYLMARSDGQHIFSRTLREHREAVREVRH